MIDALSSLSRPPKLYPVSDILADAVKVPTIAGVRLFDRYEYLLIS
jgi:hypothetical protein